MADSGLEQTLTKGKVAGVPVWGAGVGMAALLILFLWWRNKNKPPVAATPTPTVDPGLVPDGMTDDSGWGLPPGPVGSWLGQNPTGPQYPVGSTPQGLPSPITNQQWSRLAFDQLVAKGDDPTLVGNALAKFLAGQTLNDAEKAIVNIAQTMFGAPPEGLIPINQPAPTPTPEAPKITTNEQWAQAAMAWLGSKPNYTGTTPLLAQIAINDYLEGKPLGLWEQWTINTIITGTNQLGKSFGPGVGPPPQIPATKIVY